MAQDLRSQKNVSLSTVSSSKPKLPTSAKKTPTLSDMVLPNSLALDDLIYAPVPTPTSTNKLSKQFMKAYLNAQTPASVKTKLQE